MPGEIKIIKYRGERFEDKVKKDLSSDGSDSKIKTRLGNRILRDLLNCPPSNQRPSCDISFDELKVLFKGVNKLDDLPFSHPGR